MNLLAERSWQSQALVSQRLHRTSGFAYRIEGREALLGHQHDFSAEAVVLAAQLLVLTRKK